MKQLEHELGVGLFDRIGRRVQLTPAGEALVGPARQVLRDVETGRAAVASVAGLGGGSLALASLPTLAADPWPGWWVTSAARYPGVVVDLAAPEDTTDLVAMVRDGRCEVGVTEAAGLPDDLVARLIGHQALVLVCPSGVRGRIPTGGRAGRPGRPWLCPSWWTRPSSPPRPAPPPGACSIRASPPPGPCPRWRWSPPSATPSSPWCWPGQERPWCPDRVPPWPRPWGPR